MDRLELLTSKEYWIEILENAAHNGLTDHQMAEDISEKIKEVLNYEQL